MFQRERESRKKAVQYQFQIEKESMDREVEIYQSGLHLIKIMGK